MNALSILNRMKLRGQHHWESGPYDPVGSDRGYAMAVLLVAMAVMAVMLTVAMPVWSRLQQREKEEELVFRGTQYARAIGLFEKKFANTPPPTLDVLVQQKFLRKKFKDPITNADFVPITASQAVITTPGSTQAGRGGAAPSTFSLSAGSGGGSAGSFVVAGGGGIVGVTSSSKAPSIRIYNGATHYNEWRFIYAPPAAAPGTGGAPGAGTPGQAGGGQRGQPGQGNQAGPFGPGRGGPGRGGPGQGGGPARGPFGPGGPGAGGPGRGPGGGTNPFQPFPAPAPNRGR
jgi:type II secretory pathway pseudopilin PulG